VRSLPGPKVDPIGAEEILVNNAEPGNNMILKSVDGMFGRIASMDSRRHPLKIN